MLITLKTLLHTLLLPPGGPLLLATAGACLVAWRGAAVRARRIGWVLLAVGLATLWLLAKDQASQQRAYDEVINVAGAGLFTAAHVDRLVFCRQVISEAMRLYPAVPGVGRLPNRAMVLGGAPVSTRTRVHIPIFALHRNERLWENPNAFRPRPLRRRQGKGALTIRLFAIRWRSKGLYRRKFRDHRGRGDLGRARSRLSFPAGCRAQTKASGTGDTTASRRDAIIRRRAGESADRGPRFLRSP